MSPLVVLVGPPGSGKTTVGRLLADRRDVAFRDTDEDIEQSTGKTVMDIFVEDGEQHFRSLERDAVARALVEHDGVLALGGGAVMDEQSRRRLAGHAIVFLEVTLPTASERVGFNRSRPLLVLNPRTELKRLLDQRRPFYEEVAATVVATDDRTPDEVVDDIDGWLAGRA